MNWLLVAIVGYVLVQFAIGTWVSRRMASEADYILAGRGLGIGLVTFSVFATYFGAEAIVASGGAVYEKGLAGALVDPVGYASAIIIVGLFFARALWSRGLTTFADLFRQRYSARRGAAGGRRAAARLGHLGGRAGAGVRPGDGCELGDGPQVGDHCWRPCWWPPIRWSADCWRMPSPMSSRASPFWPGCSSSGLSSPVHVGGVSAGLAQVEPQRLKLLDCAGEPVGTLEQLAIPICGTIVAVELISRFLGARSAEVAGMGTVLGGGIYLIVGLVPVFLGLVGPAPLAQRAGCRADRRRAGQGLSARAALHCVRRGDHLGHSFGRSRGVARPRLADLAQHRGPARPRPHRPRQAVVRAPDGHGAEHRCLSSLRHVPAHPRPGGDGIGFRQCRRVRDRAVCALHAASAGPRAPMPRWRPACSCGRGASMRSISRRPTCWVVGGPGGLRRRGGCWSAPRS